MAGNRYDHGPLAAWLAVLGACQAVLPPKASIVEWCLQAASTETGRMQENLPWRPLRLALLCVFCLLHCLKPGPVLPVLPWAVGLISESWKLLMVSHFLSCHPFVS